MTPVHLEPKAKVFFCGDFHLLPAQRPEVLVKLCKEHLNPGDHLVILGDFFEAYVENIFAYPHEYDEVLSMLRSCSDKGIRGHLIQGNRDFLTGRHFMVQSGFAVHTHPLSFQQGQQRILACHGDELLPLDLSYQRYKSMIRSIPSRFLLSLTPLSLLKYLAGRVRTKSITKISKLEKSSLEPSMTVIEPLMRTELCINAIAGHLHQDLELRQKGLCCNILPESSHEKIYYRLWQDGHLGELQAYAG